MDDSILIVCDNPSEKYGNQFKGIQLQVIKIETFAHFHVYIACVCAKILL